MRISDGSSDVCSSDLQVAVHTNGDAAIDVALDAIEAAISSAPERDHRHRLEHVQTVREDQLDRIAAAGILPSVFVNHVYYWGDRHRDRFLGPERAARISPLRSVVDRGMTFGLHCDCPVTPVRTEERRVVKEWVSPCRYWGAP